MRLLALLVTFFCACVLAVPASAESQQRKDRVRTLVDRSHALHQELKKTASPTRKLSLLDRELDLLRRANGIVRVYEAADKYGSLAQTIERRLIAALNAKTRIYIKRGALPQAVKANRAALSYRMTSVEALQLRHVLSSIASKDLFEEYEGQASIRRLRDRRAAGGSAVRDRGLARRR